jgi:MFS family permease
MNLAAQAIGVAVGWQVYAISHRPLDLGYVGLVQFVPSVGFAILAGHVADRFDRSRIVAGSNFALAAAAVALAFVSSSTERGVGPIYLVLFFVGTAKAFGAPAGEALVPALVLPEDFPRAVTWSSTAWQLSTIVGPSLGGVLYGVASARVVYGAAAVLFACAAILALSITPRPLGTAASVGFRTVLAGFSYVRRHRVIFESISLDLFAVLLGGATALLPVFASDVLHTGPLGLGLLRSAPALGAALTALVLTARPLVRRAGPVMLGCVGVFGAATVVFAISKNFALSLGALLVLGAADMVSVVVRSTIVQLRTPPAMRGRVSAVNMMFIAGSSELGELESGLTAAWLGAVPAALVGGLGTLAAVAIAAVFSEIRKVDRLDDVAADEA